MKKLFFLFCIALISCSQFNTLDENLAKKKAEELLELIKEHQYDKASACYSAEFNESESTEARAKKFEQIESASGPVTRYEFVSSEKKEMDERSVLICTYKVFCQNTTLTETLIVGLEEGDCKILNHNITNQ